MLKKTTQLKTILNSKGINFFLEAHSGLSAKIVEEVGFSGIWASGLTISASLGVRDNNEASWTQILDVLEFMSDVTSVPILADVDTGFGNFNNVRRLVKKLEQCDIAGMCIEDKEFPKKNSFINSEAQTLAQIEEFTGKIKAARDTQKDNDFCIIARTETLVTGKTMDEAIHRCEKYYEAGADAVLIHSKRSTSQEIEEFVKLWQQKCPVVIVPTTYYKTPTSIFINNGISLILWANHMLRASVHQMQRVANQIFLESSVIGINENIAPLKEIFRLQQAEELEAAEAKYLPHVKYV